MRMWPFNVVKISGQQTLARKHQDFRHRDSFDQRLARYASNAYWRPRLRPGTSAASKELAQLSAADFTYRVLAPLKKVAREAEGQFTTYQHKARRWRGGMRTALSVAMWVAGVSAVLLLAEMVLCFVQPVYEKLLHPDCPSSFGVHPATAGNEGRIWISPSYIDVEIPQEIWDSHPEWPNAIVPILKRQKEITSSLAELAALECVMYQSQLSNLKMIYVYLPAWCLFGLLCVLASRLYSSLGWLFLLATNLVNTAAFLWFRLGMPIVKTDYRPFIITTLCLVLLQIFLKVILQKNLTRLFKRDKTVEGNLVVSFEQTLAEIWRSRAQDIRDLFHTLHELFARLVEHIASHLVQKLLRCVGASSGGVSASSEAHALSLLSAHLATVTGFRLAHLMAQVETTNGMRGGRADALATI